MTRRIVEAQGGKIEVESTLGEGSIFYIILPYCAPKDRYGYMNPLKSKVNNKTPCILVIEDKSNERANLVDDLAKEGYRLMVANNIEEALANYQVTKADAIILDFFISDINKWKLLRTFRNKEPFKNAPSLLITGCVANIEAFGFKIHDFLVRPCKPSKDS